MGSLSTLCCQTKEMERFIPDMVDGGCGTPNLYMLINLRCLEFRTTHTLAALALGSCATVSVEHLAFHPAWGTSGTCHEDMVITVVMRLQY